MKINAIVPEQAISIYSATSVKPRQSQPVSLHPQPDRVELSEDAVSFAQVMKAAKQMLQADDTAEAGRVAALTTQVRSGVYDVKGYDIAASMIRNIARE